MITSYALLWAGKMFCRPHEAPPLDLICLRFACLGNKIWQNGGSETVAAAYVGAATSYFVHVRMEIAGRPRKEGQSSCESGLPYVSPSSLPPPYSEYINTLVPLHLLFPFPSHQPSHSFKSINQTSKPQNKTHNYPSQWIPSSSYSLTVESH